MYIVIAYIIVWFLLLFISMLADANSITVRFLMLVQQSDFFSVQALFIASCMLILTYYLKTLIQIEDDENEMHLMANAKKREDERRKREATKRKTRK